VPALVFALYLLAHRELKRIVDLMLPLGAVVVAAIVVPWYAVLYHRYGWTHISSFLFGENIARYTEGLGVQTTRGPLFYLPVVFTDSAPVAFLLIGAAAAWVADWRSPARAHPAFRVRTLIWLWIVGIIAFFTFSAAKQDLYIFPIVPAVAAAVGIFISRATT